MGTRTGFWLAAVMALSSIASWGQSARDTFWSANDLISVTPNPAAHNRSRPHSSSSAQKSVSAAVTPTTGSVYTPHESRDEQVAQLVATNGYGAAPHLVRDSETRLGLRCSLLLRGPDKEYNEVTLGTVFHSGDHLRLSLLANQSGYLYVVQKGSTGAWSPVYPPPSAAPDAAKISPGQLEVVPGGTKAFQFDEHPGAERLYVILSRTPIEDIDRVIRNLSHGAAAPASPADASLELEAKNVIPDELVQKLAGRDLKLVDEETVDASSTSAPDSERAVYVVAKKSDTPSSEQVILSLELRHE
jgi:Domain of unknown function (DUF4384)